MIRLQPEVVLKRAEKAEDRKDEWRSIYEDCYTYALPQRNLYGHYEGGGRGQSKMDNVFDSTAINSTQRFANRLQSAIFPPYRNWCSLQSGTDVPVEQIDGLNRALDLYTDKMFEVIRQTNFDLAMSEFLLDLAVGTGVMLIQGGDDVTPIRFEAVPPFLVALEQGPHGKIDNVYRKIRIKGEAIQQQWSDAKIPEPLAEKIKTKPTDDIDLLEATIYIPEDDYWCYHIIWPHQKSELVYRVLESSPWIIARYIVCAGEIWGRGPLLSALPDIKTINHTKKMLLQNASIAISGMYTAADDGVLNPSTIRIQPGAIIPVARNGGPQGASLAPLPRSGDFNLAQIVINDLSMGIKKIMLDDTLPPDSASARSATEINSRMAELAQNLGSAFGRLLTEALIPITSRILRVMDERNIIDMPMRVDGREIKVVPISPLARAQAQEDLNSVMQFMQLAGGMGPNGMLSINQDELIAFVADRLGVPQKILNSPEQKAEMMLMAKQQMEQMAQQSQGGPAIAAPQ